MGGGASQLSSNEKNDQYLNSIVKTQASTDCGAHCPRAGHDIHNKTPSNVRGSYPHYNEAATQGICELLEFTMETFKIYGNRAWNMAHLGQSNPAHHVAEPNRYHGRMAKP